MKKIVIDWLKAHWIHLLVWFIFIMYETVMVGIIFGAFGNVLNYVVHYSIIIAYFYFGAEWVLPWAMKNKIHSYWRIPLAYGFMIAIFVLVNFSVDYILVNYKFIQHNSVIQLNFGYTVKLLYRCIYFLGFSTGYLLLINFLNERKKRETLERQRLNNIIKEERMLRALSKAQNDYLKAQINPHFLFNTLDYIYHNVNGHSPEAGDAIITLAEMMRYAIASNEVDEFIVLGDEIEQAEKLIYLYQLRKNNELNIRTYFSEGVRELKFIPLVLLTLVENIFKHGNVSDPVHETTIWVFLRDQQLIVESKNGLNAHAKFTGTQSGLKNIKNRLRFAYGDEIDFKVASDAHYFQVKIAVPLARVMMPEQPSRLSMPQSN